MYHACGSYRKGSTDGASRLDERPGQGGDRIPTAHPRFEEDEALAFWLLQQAEKQMDALRQADVLKEMNRHEGRLDQLALQHAVVLENVARWHAGIHQHFTTLQAALGARVLGRTFPEGWGVARTRIEDTDNEEG